MGQPTSNYFSNRVLKINVGFLLAAGPGHSHDTTFDAPAVRVADDLTLDYIRGPLRLSRTKEGVLVQGELHVGFSGDCYRCLDTVTANITIEFEELFAYPSPAAAEFSLHDDGVLDLGPLLRAEVFIATTNNLLCRPDCRGLCPDCGANLNTTQCACAAEQVDPRMAKLKELLESHKR